MNSFMEAYAGFKELLATASWTIVVWLALKLSVFDLILGASSKLSEEVPEYVLRTVSIRGFDIGNARIS